MFKIIVAAAAALALISGAAQAKEIALNECLGNGAWAMLSAPWQAPDAADAVMGSCLLPKDGLTVMDKAVIRERLMSIITRMRAGPLDEILIDRSAVGIGSRLYTPASCSSPCGCYINSNRHEVP